MVAFLIGGEYAYTEYIVWREPFSETPFFEPCDCATLVSVQAESPEGARKVFTKWVHWKLPCLSQ